MEKTRRHNAFSRSPICVPRLYYFGGETEQRERAHGVEEKRGVVVHTWWWSPFVSLIVSVALFLSSLVTSATGFAPMAQPRKNATYCAKSIWPAWLLPIFSGIVSPFFHVCLSRGGHVFRQPLRYVLSRIG